MIKIMFVCHGNICRSPMAEFILKKIVKSNGREDDFYITSSGTSGEEICMGVGNPVYPAARWELSKHDIFCGDKRAVKLQKSDYEKYDHFICMDSFNVRNARRILGEDKDKKISKLLYWKGSRHNIYDPWYNGDFTTAYNQIYESCLALFEKLSEQDSKK